MAQLSLMKRKPWRCRASSSYLLMGNQTLDDPELAGDDSTLGLLKQAQRPFFWALSRFSKQEYQRREVGENVLFPYVFDF
jgi:hypothetical protein